jgi:hypothetical protein
MISSRVECGDDATLQNFIYKHTVDLENVQRNKKKRKREIPEWGPHSVMSAFNYSGNALILGPHPSCTKALS